MGITVKKGKVSSATYTIKGDTLAELNEEIGSKGPKDGNDGKRYSGSCKCEAELVAASVKVAFAVEDAPAGKKATATISAGTLTYDCTITMPKRGGKLSKTAEKEWDRFVKAVQTHEDGHVDEYGKEMTQAGLDVEALSGTGEGADEKAAKTAAVAALKTELQTIDLSARILANAKAYDKRTDHGKTQKAVLDASVA